MKSEIYYKEMEFIKDWVFTILDFLIENTNKEEERFLFIMSKKSWVNFYQKRIFSGFKEGFNDTNIIAKHLPKNLYIELNKILQNKFSTNIETIKSDSKFKQ